MRPSPPLGELPAPRQGKARRSRGGRLHRARQEAKLNAARRYVQATATAEAPALDLSQGSCNLANTTHVHQTALAYVAAVQVANAAYAALINATQSAAPQKAAQNADPTQSATLGFTPAQMAEIFANEHAARPAATQYATEDPVPAALSAAQGTKVAAQDAAPPAGAAQDAAPPTGAAQDAAPPAGAAQDAAPAPGAAQGAAPTAAKKNAAPAPAPAAAENAATAAAKENAAPAASAENAAAVAATESAATKEKAPAQNTADITAVDAAGRSQGQSQCSRQTSGELASLVVSETAAGENAALAAATKNAAQDAAVDAAEDAAEKAAQDAAMNAAVNAAVDATQDATRNAATAENAVPAAPAEYAAPTASTENAAQDAAVNTAQDTAVIAAQDAAWNATAAKIAAQNAAVTKIAAQNVAADLFLSQDHGLSAVDAVKEAERIADGTVESDGSYDEWFKHYEERMASDDSDSDDDGSDHRIYKFKGSISDFRRVVCKFCRHEDKNARLDCLVDLGNCCKQANEIRTHDWMNSEEYKSVSSEGNDVCKFCNTSHKDTLIAAKLPEDWPSYQLSNCCEQNYFAFEQYSSKESTIRLLQQYLVMPEDNEEEARTWVQQQ